MAVASLCILCEPGGCRQDLASVPCHVGGPHGDTGSPIPYGSSDGRGLLDAVEADAGWGGGDGHGPSHAGADGVLVLPPVPPLPHGRADLGVQDRGHSVTTWSFRGTSHPRPLFSNPKCYKNARLQAELVFAHKEGCRPTPPNPRCSPRCSGSSRRLRQRNPGRRQAAESPWSYRWPQAREIWSSHGVWGGLFFGGRRVRHQPQDGLHIPQWEYWDRS